MKAYHGDGGDYCRICGRWHIPNPNCLRRPTESLLEARRKDKLLIDSGAIDSRVVGVQNFCKD